jgi:hypothetical protein
MKPRIFTDTEFQRYKLSKVKDHVVRLFWEKEMAKTSDFHKSEMLGYLISKVGRFVENTMMRNIVGQSKSGFNFRKVMDEGKVLLVNLSKGRTGEINAKLLGLILVSKIQMAALSRADIPEEKRRDFYLYVDEFQNFITDAFSSILSEARKYKLNLIIAHQYLGQLETQAGAQGAGSKDLRDAVFGNVGTMVVFRTGAEEAYKVKSEKFNPVANPLIRVQNGGELVILERHRHRYEVNPEYIAQLEKGGLVFSGRSPDGTLMEIAELPRSVHPFFLGTQFHPELLARPLVPHPLFTAFMKASKVRAKL